MTPYTPTPGSIADRAIAYLSELILGAEVTSKDLAAFIGCRTEGIHASLETAVKAGVIRSRVVKRVAHWSMAQPDPFDESRQGMPLQRTVPATATRTATRLPPSSVFDLGDRLAGTEATPDTTAAEPPAQPAKPAAAAATPWRAPVTPARTKQAHAKHTRVTPAAPAPQPRELATATAPAVAPPIACALFNTGDLVIEVPDQPALRLTRAQTRELVGYLDRLATTAEAVR